MKHRTFEMLCVRAKLWYTAMINGNCQNRTAVKHGMMFCCLLCATTYQYAGFSACHDFFSLFVCHSPSQSWTSSIGLVSLWVSVLVLDIKVLVLVLELLSLGLGLGTAESWSWSWSWICWVLVLVLVLVLDKQVLNPSLVWMHWLQV